MRPAIILPSLACRGVTNIAHSWNHAVSLLEAETSTPDPTTGRSGVSSPATLIALLSAAFALVLFGYFQVQNVLSPSSYWFDELFSVTTSNAGLGHALTATFQDVHPPLYQVLLWAWISLFGDAEVATRSLSLMCTAAALAVAAHAFRPAALLPTLTIVVVLAAHPFVHFYAMETRAYALLLFLATASLVSTLRNRPRETYFFCACLGLTHFFGTLLALILLAAVFLRRPSYAALFSGASVALIVTAWPVSQVLLGTATERLGGNFWIEAGAADCLDYAAWNVWPPAFDVIQAAGTPAWLPAALIFALMGLAAGTACAASSPEHRFGPGPFLFGVAAAFVLSTVLINAHTPVCTDRNFIVLAPVGPLLAALVVQGALRNGRGAQAILPLAGAAYLAASFPMIAERLGSKLYWFQDWRGLASTASALSSENAAPLYFLGREGPNKRIYEFYLPKGMEAAPFASSEIAAHQTFVVMAGHRPCSELEALVRLLSAGGYRYGLHGLNDPADCRGRAMAVVVASRHSAPLDRQSVPNL